MKEFFELGGLTPYIDAWLKTDATGAGIVYLLTILLSILVPFFIGRINVAHFVSSKVYHISLLEQGASEESLTMLFHHLGYGALTLGLVFEALKVFLALLFAAVLSGSGHTGGFELYFQVYLAALFVTVGDAFPGKSASNHSARAFIPAFFASLWLSLYITPLLLLIFFVMLFISKYTSLSIAVTMAIYPVFYSSLFKAFFSNAIPGQNLLCVFALVICVIFTHKDRLTSTFNHEEPQVSFHPKYKD